LRILSVFTNTAHKVEQFSTKLIRDFGIIEGASPAAFQRIAAEAAANPRHV